MQEACRLAVKELEELQTRIITLEEENEDLKRQVTERDSEITRFRRLAREIMGTRSHA